MVGEQVVLDLGTVDGRSVVGLQRPGSDDRLGGEPTGQQRLADAFAGHHVGGHRRVAGEQHPPGGERGLVDPRGDRPRGVAILELEAVAEGVDDVGSGEEIEPELLHVLDATAAVAQHAESDVDPATGKRKRPGVAGNQVGFEPDVQLLRRRGR